MPVATAKRFRTTLVCLLILCLSPTAMTAPWLGALHTAGVDSKPVLIICAFAGAASVSATLTRNRMTGGFDDLLKAALVSGRPILVFTRKSLPFLFEDNTGVVHRIDRTVIPIRAPPLYRHG